MGADEQEPVRLPLETWRSVRSNRASQDIIDQVREAFFRGLKPGDWLGTEGDLAERFEVSRITVRDAVRTLEASGIVEVKVGAKGGVRIASGDPDRFADALAVQLQLIGIEWSELLEAQLAIEAITAERAAENVTLEQLTELEAILDQCELVLDEPETFTELSLQFHLGIAAAARNRALAASLRALRQVQVQEYTPHTSREVAVGVLKAHRDIYGKIATGDALGARALMSEHLHHVEARATERMSERSASPEGVRNE